MLFSYLKAIIKKMTQITRYSIDGLQVIIKSIKIGITVINFKVKNSFSFNSLVWSWIKIIYLLATLSIFIK